MTNGPVVELKEVSLRREHTLLDGVTWTVEPGQHWIVLGRNGAGKTLLLRIIAGYLWPSRGEVLVLGERFGRVDLRRLRRDIGWVSSAMAEKFPSWDTALSVVLSGADATFGLYRQPSADLTERAGGLIREMGLDGLAGRKYENLSAGEKQRVLLARSRLAEPRLLILDEPCAGLDLAAREKYLRLVQELTSDEAGPTLVMVTHRVSEIMPGFTHALVLAHGRVLAAGPIDEVLTNDTLARAMEIGVKAVRVRGRWRIQME